MCRSPAACCAATAWEFSDGNFPHILEIGGSTWGLETFLCEHYNKEDEIFNNRPTYKKTSTTYLSFMGHRVGFVLFYFPLTIYANYYFISPRTFLIYNYV